MTTSASMTAKMPPARRAARSADQLFRFRSPRSAQLSPSASPLTRPSNAVDSKPPTPNPLPVCSFTQKIELIGRKEMPDSSAKLSGLWRPLFGVLRHLKIHLVWHEILCPRGRALYSLLRNVKFVTSRVFIS